MADVDVVVVSYNSRDRLRRCIEPLTGIPRINVIVVDNDSPDRSLETIADLPVTALQLNSNGGFAVGCNSGWRAGGAPGVLFLNPDACIYPDSVRALAQVLRTEELVGVVGPRIEHDDGSLAYSQRRFPRLASIYGRALLLHRLLPRASWTSEVVADPALYAHPASPDWVSGACILVRRQLLERLGGLDEGFFLYCEDKDLCRRVRDLGYEVRFDPRAVAVHEGGASAPRPALLPILAESRIRYARKHRGVLAAQLERVGVGLLALTRSVISPGGRRARAGHLAAFKTILR